MKKFRPTYTLLHKSQTVYIERSVVLFVVREVTGKENQCEIMGSNGKKSRSLCALWVHIR